MSSLYIICQLIETCRIDISDGLNMCGRSIDFLLKIVTVSHWSVKSRTNYNHYQHGGQRECE